MIYIGFTSLYTFLHWFLVIEKGLINLKEDILNFWLPFGLPYIPIFIWLRPRIHLLNFKKDDANFFYQFVASLAITATTIVSQEYMVKETGKLTPLTNITELNGKDVTKYYSLEKYHFDKENANPYGTYEISGKHNEDLNYYIYCVLPIYTDTSSTKSTCLAWLGVKKIKRISNRLDASKKDTIYHKFYKEAWDSFKEEDLSKFVYLESIANSKDLDNYKEAIKRNSKFNGGEIVVFKSINEPFEARKGEKFKWIFLTFAIGSLLWLVLLFFPSLNISKFRTYQQNGRLPTKKSDLAEILELLTPQGDFFITPIIANLNILIYLIMVICGLGFLSFKGTGLLNWGANFRPYVVKGEWWRLFTSTFLHGGAMHLLANIYGLIFVGSFLEPVLGRFKYIAVYCITGILASLASIWWYEATVSVGASGAIFGLYGTFIALLVTNIFPREMKGSFLLSTVIFIGFNLIMGLTGGIDNAAHIGGLLSGFIIGLLLNPTLRKIH